MTEVNKRRKGSTFRVFLPESAAEHPRQTDQAAQPAIIVPTLERITVESGTILLVEDEEMVRNMATAMLTRLGSTVMSAKDGVEAVEILQRHRDEICLVLSDLTMPRLDDWETLTALRQLAPDLPAIIPNCPRSSWASPISSRSLGTQSARL